MNRTVRRTLAACSAAGVAAAAVAVGLGASGAAAAPKARAAAAPSWCGPKKITLALADGFGDNNWRQITTENARVEAAECPSVTKFVYTDGQGNT